MGSVFKWYDKWNIYVEKCENSKRCKNVTRRCKSKHRKSNVQMYRYKMTNNELQNTTQKIKYLATYVIELKYQVLWKGR